MIDAPSEQTEGSDSGRERLMPAKLDPPSALETPATASVSTAGGSDRSEGEAEGRRRRRSLPVCRLAVKFSSSFSEVLTDSELPHVSQAEFQRRRKCFLEADGDVGRNTA